MPNLFSSLLRPFQRGFGQLHKQLIQWTRPTSRSLLGGTLTDLARSTAGFCATSLMRAQIAGPVSTWPCTNTMFFQHSCRARLHGQVYWSCHIAPAHLV